MSEGEREFKCLKCGFQGEAFDFLKTEPADLVDEFEGIHSKTTFECPECEGLAMVPADEETNGD